MIKYLKILNSLHNSFLLLLCGVMLTLYLNKFNKLFRMQKTIKYISLLILFLLTVNVSFSSVEVFSQYDTKITISKNYTLDVEKTLKLRNVHDVGIVPGQIEFKIESLTDKKIGEVINYTATDRYGNNIRSYFRKSNGASYIILDIFTPVLPGFEYIINLDYQITYDSTGFFFKNLQVPLKEKTKIPIQKGTIEINIPENYHLTYLDFYDNTTIKEDNKIIWELTDTTPDAISIEYSYLPINIGGIRGSLIFWLTINLILIAVLLGEIIKEARKLKNN